MLWQERKLAHTRKTDCTADVKTIFTYSVERDSETGEKVAGHWCSVCRYVFALYLVFTTYSSVLISKESWATRRNTPFSRAMSQVAVHIFRGMQ